jgi:peroxiredoxin
MKHYILIFLFSICLFSIPIAANPDDKPIAENFTVTTLEGKQISLEGLRGKVVVLAFWSTGCPICEKEIPKFNEIAEKYAGKNVVFLGLTREKGVKVAEHLKKKPFKFTVVPNSGEVMLRYADKNPDGSFSIAYPMMYVINQKGEIELKTNGRNKSKIMDNLINQLLVQK